MKAHRNPMHFHVLLHIQTASEARLRHGGGSAKLTSLLMLQLWAGVLAVHFHCPHRRCWRQLLSYQASIWRSSRTANVFSKDHLPEDEYTGPNHPVSPTAALFLWLVCFCERKWALAGNKLLNQLPSLKCHEGMFAGRQVTEEVIKLV